MRGTYFLTRLPENLLAALGVYPQHLANCLLLLKIKLQAGGFSFDIDDVPWEYDIHILYLGIDQID